MSTYMVVVTRKRDGFVSVPGIGSLEGCISEARSIRRLLTSYGETFSACGDRWTSERARIDLVPYDAKVVKASATWNREDFYRAKLRPILPVGCQHGEDARHDH